MKRKGAGQAVTTAPMLFPGEERNVAELSQWYTPPRAARALHDFAAIPAGARVLEPSAGRGALILPRPDLVWTAIDIDQVNCVALLATSARDVGQADFLAIEPPDEPFHYACMNPPYENGADLAHVLHALDFAERVVVLLGSDAEHRVGWWRELWRWLDGPIRKLAFIGRPFKGAMSDYAIWDLPGSRNGPASWRASEPRGGPWNVIQVWGRG